MAIIMSTLRKQVIQSLNGLSDDNLKFLLDMIQRFMKPAESREEINTSTSVKNNIRRLGSLKGQNLVASGYDIDECNDEIAEMFGVSGK